MAPMAPEEFGSYVVYERLGTGGMASVHRAQSRNAAGTPVALKRLLPELSLIPGPPEIQRVLMFQRSRPFSRPSVRRMIATFSMMSRVSPRSVRWSSWSTALRWAPCRSSARLRAAQLAKLLAQFG